MLGTNTPAAKMIYRKRNFVFYYTLYANWIQNTLIKISTWFTVILGAGRSFAVSYPITARKYLKCKHTVGAILTCSVLWVILKCPTAYTWTVQGIKLHSRYDIHTSLWTIYRERCDQINIHLHLVFHWLRYSSTGLGLL